MQGNAAKEKKRTSTVTVLLGWGQQNRKMAQIPATLQQVNAIDEKDKKKVSGMSLMASGYAEIKIHKSLCDCSLKNVELIFILILSAIQWNPAQLDGTWLHLVKLILKNAKTRYILKKTKETLPNRWAMQSNPVRLIHNPVKPSKPRFLLGDRLWKTLEHSIKSTKKKKPQRYPPLTLSDESR